MNAALAELLRDVETFVRRFVVLTDEQAVTIALWVVHTHAPDVLGITPYLGITSAEKRSGKTHLLEVLEQLVSKPWLTGSVTAATLARKIHEHHPTLLLDESDTAFSGDREYAETLRGVLNTGFKASGTYSRCVGASGTALKVFDFETFCPKAIAGINRLPETVADRSIPIRLKRKAPHERVERKRERKVAEEAVPLRDRIQAWVNEPAHYERLAGLDLAPLDELGDRAADIWEPLLGIGYTAGERCYARARAAAVRLSATQADDDESTGVRLLRDIRSVLGAAGDKVFSETLVTALHAIEESPWAEWRGRPISKNSVARILKRFDIRPHTVRIGDDTAKGYAAEQFADAFKRYLGETPAPPPGPVTTPQTAWLMDEPENGNRHVAELVTSCDNGAYPDEQSNVTAVTDAPGVGARHAAPTGSRQSRAAATRAATG